MCPQVFFLNAAVTERLLQHGSIRTYLEEEADLAESSAGGKLRHAILTGGKMIAEELGLKLENLELDSLGTARARLVLRHPRGQPSVLAGADGASDAVIVRRVAVAAACVPVHRVEVVINA